MIDRHALFQAFASLVPQPQWTDELALARSVAFDAGETLLSTFGALGGRPKADGSLVTDADLAADRLIADRIRAAFPGDTVLSEEVSPRFDGGDRVWVVDPLDGTANYAHRVPMWGVSLALVAGGRPVVGVSHFPCLRLTFWAVAGGGAWEGERRLAAIASPDVSDQDLVAYCSRTPLRFDVAGVGKGRMLGSETLNLAMVASGAVHASLAATSHVWDLAAGWLLVHEAGGVVRTLDEQVVWPLEPADYADRTFATAAAGNPALLAAVERRIRR
jgi:myo-inositol-1(or 4)-monophosphatase